MGNPWENPKPMALLGTNTQLWDDFSQNKFSFFFQTLCLFSLSSKARQDGEGAKAASEPEFVAFGQFYFYGGLIQTMQLQPGKPCTVGGMNYMATSTWRILIHFHNMGPVTGKNPRNMADACQPG